MHLDKKPFLKLLLIIAGFGICAISANGSDPELTNYKSGISLEWLGEKGVNYQEEYLYFDKVICDKKVVYINDSTLIRMFHNERNKAGTSGGSDAYESVGPEIGQIRYKIDGDHRWQLYPTDWTAYTDPIAIKDLNYELYGEPEVPVLGSTGNNGIELTNANKTHTYHKGILDSYGDEWHTITVADDDRDHTSNNEFRSSDGKIFYLVVNPKTPALSIRADGDAQYYTTPPKKYFTPIIYNQTTYIRNGSTGQVTFELNALNGKKVFARIVPTVDDETTPFSTNDSSRIIFDQNDFEDGEQCLQYYFEGNEEHVKTRKVIKNPPFPSADEDHGNRLWISEDYFNEEVLPRVQSERSWWLDQWKNYDQWGKRNSIEAWARKGERTTFSATAFPNAFIARIYGNSASPPKYDKSFADYAKLALFEAPSVIDPVGAELNSSNTPIPCREIIYRGYYDVTSFIDAATAYDLLIASFRTDQGFDNGISPIEDFYIRDSLASWVYLSLLIDSAGYGDPIWSDFNSGGMWDTARKVGALMIACMMPNYSTEYYGTCGLDGKDAIYPWTPFRDVNHTWKEILIDNDVEMTGFPNVHKRFGVEEYNLTDDGKWDGRVAYSDTYLMGHTLATYWNLMALYNPRMQLPRSISAQNNAAKFELYGNQFAIDADREPAFRAWAGVQNEWYPDFRDVAGAKMQTISSKSNYSLGKQLQRGGPLYIIWYDHKLPRPSVPIDPSLLDTNKEKQEP